MAYFNFISDDALIAAVKKIHTAAERTARIAQDDIHKNTLDPFAAMFAMLHTNSSYDEWEQLEIQRQSQKTIQNAIGEFHQELLGNFSGWNNPGRGGSVDLVNEDKKIIAEIKNKHNTMNSSSAAETYNKLANHLKYDRKGYTAYLVQIVPKTPINYDVPWSPNLTTMNLRNDIRRIDGESFYDVASGEVDTLLRIYQRIPHIYAKIAGTDPSEFMSTESCEQLFKSVYK